MVLTAMAALEAEGMGTVFNVISSRRSIRKFQQAPVSEELLFRCVETARLAPSAANLQPCEYVIITDKDLKMEIFKYLSWAAYLGPHEKPSAEEQPAAYIAVLLTASKKRNMCQAAAGASIQNMMLTAWAEGVGSCWIRSVETRKAKKIMRIPHNVTLDSIIAFGYPAEKSVVEDMDESIQYFKDKDGVMHVPKRKLLTILFDNQYGRFYKPDQIVI